MNNDQNLIRTLREKLFNCGCFQEPEDVTAASVFGDSSFKTVEDLELLATLPQLKSLVIPELPDELPVEKLVSTLEKFPALESLEFSNITIAPPLMKGIIALKNVQELAFRNVKCEDSTLVFLCWQDHLTSLKFLEQPSIPGVLPEILDTLPQLESLNLINSNLGKFPILSFAKDHLPNLKNLLWKPRYLTGDDIETMISMELESLWLPLIIRDKGYRHLDFLNRFRSLKNLYVTGAPPIAVVCGFPSTVTIDWVIPNLNTLFLFDLPSVKMVDFSGMPHLKAFTNSCCFDLDHSPIDFRNLGSLKELKEFNIGSRCPMSPILQDLENSPNLEVLFAKDHGFLKPEDVPHLEGLKNLEKVCIGIDDQVTAQDIEKLSAFPKLTSLFLRNTKDNGVVGAFEKKCPKLRFLFVDGKAADEDVQIFASESPKFSITITDCSTLSPESIDAIFSRKELNHIVLNDVPNENLKVQDLQNLRILQLRNVKNLMDAEFVNLPLLEVLPLDCPTLESLKILDLPNLENLQIPDCPMLYLVWLRNLPKLSILNIKGSKGLDLPSLVWLPNLEILEMDYEQFQQDFVLETLQELPQLRLLVIYGYYQALGIKDLTPFENRTIWLDDDFEKEEEDEAPDEEQKKNPLEAEQEKIQNALPNCKVKFG